MPRKRIASKGNSQLRKIAEDAWLYFWLGRSFRDHVDTKDYTDAELAAAWQLVRREYMENYPITATEYGCGGFWEYECPAAPFTYEPIRGLEYESEKYFKRLALIKWGLLPTNCHDPMIDEAECVEAAIEAGITSMRFPLYTPEAERRATWKRLLAKRAALVKLGYLKGEK